MPEATRVKTGGLCSSESTSGICQATNGPERLNIMTDELMWVGGSNTQARSGPPLDLGRLGADLDAAAEASP